jgi:hypothetical protein
MGLSNARPYGESKNGDGVSTTALFTIVAEILKRQREDVSETDESASVEEKGNKENDKTSKE